MTKQRIVKKVAETKTLQLDYPIKIKREDGTFVETSEVIIERRMKLKHIKAVPDEVMQKLQQAGEGTMLAIADCIPLLLAMTTLTAEEADELGMTDFSRIMEVISKNF